ncbi:MAG: SDR family oxidoreductase [Microscillaceae bacterium]|jgi:NAD(P)-dependent dehydrogenase (short-subunit alcohol dehydrogenase family)|nr:SDR family oxidoreductase [Microscillaceae bacterium]
MLYQEPMLREGALQDQVIIVTGGGTGLGRAMTKYFLELGAKCVISSRKLDVLEKTAEELMHETGGKVLPVQCDVREYHQVEQMVADTLAHFGKIDALVNNAAGNFISPTEKVNPKGFSTVMNIVLQGTYNCTYAVGTHWIETKQTNKKVLNIVATFAWTGSGYVVPSACAKSGVLTMTKSLAVEWAKYGMRFNAIAPGYFPTKGMVDRLFPENLQKMLDPTANTPVKRAGEFQELANLAAYLVSDYSGFVNGECITLDGGAVLVDGTMNYLDKIPAEMWNEIEQMVRAANKRG